MHSIYIYMYIYTRVFQKAELRNNNNINSILFHDCTIE